MQHLPPTQSAYVPLLLHLFLFLLSLFGILLHASLPPFPLSATSSISPLTHPSPPLIHPHSHYTHTHLLPLWEIEQNSPQLKCDVTCRLKHLGFLSQECSFTMGQKMNIHTYTYMHTQESVLFIYQPVKYLEVKRVSMLPLRTFTIVLRIMCMCLCSGVWTYFYIILYLWGHFAWHTQWKTQFVDQGLRQWWEALVLDVCYPACFSCFSAPTHLI